MLHGRIVPAIGGLLLAASGAMGAVIQSGTYRLHNHPDGNQRPPLYGLRLDELYDVTGTHDVFTFDFDHPSSAMFMDYFGGTIHIHGQSYGGRDTGSGYAADVHRGVYSIDFTYNVGVGLAPGDDDLLVTLPPLYYNYGWIDTPAGDWISLRDGHYGGDRPDFRFGDEDDDAGHRGFNGLSGWGWLFHGPPGAPYHESSDWLFTAELVPAPGVFGLLAGMGLLAARRRR